MKRRIVKFFENLLLNYYFKTDSSFIGFLIYKPKRKFGMWMQNILIKILQKNSMTAEQVLEFCRKNEDAIRGKNEFQAFVHYRSAGDHLVNLCRQGDRLTLKVEELGKWDSGRSFIIY